MRFLLALTVAALYDSLLKMRGICVALLDTSERVDPELADQRLAVCNSCPIYFAPLRTCGSPLMKDKTKGCHCYMPQKAQLKSNCWAFDNEYLTFGWPDELNSHL